MPQVVYKSLDKQVKDMIESYGEFSSADVQTSQYFAGGNLAMGSSVDTKELASILSGFMGDMKNMVKPWIKNGLNITASDPWDSKVIITSGAGFAGGREQILNRKSTVLIPLDNETSVWYLNVWNGQIAVESYSGDDKLNIGKVIIPNPGTTARIRDDASSTGWDGYIVSAKDVFYDEDTQFDDISKQVLKDVIGDIFAENIIGNMTIGESLKVTNEQGTLKITSKDVQILYDDSNIAARFDKRGTFFYDENGLEIAKFSSTEARIGNIKITPASIESGNFVSGSTGFKIADTGTVEFDDATMRGTIHAEGGDITGLLTVGDTSGTHIRIDGPNIRLESSDFISGTAGQGWRIGTGEAEFQNIRARGKLSTAVFEKKSISSVGGTLMVIDSDILDVDMTALDASTLQIIGDTTFAVNDTLRIKDNLDDEWIQVTDISSAPIYTVTRDKASAYSADSNPTWKKGTAVVNLGQSGTGGIFMSSSESSSPYIDFFTHSGSGWSNQFNKCRIGNLDGIAGASGWGIWAGDGYLGELEVIDNIGISSQGTIRSNLSGNYPYLEFSNTGLQLKDSDTGGTYGTGVYGTAKYGYGALVWILNSSLGIPWAELKEPTLSGNTVASFRFFNRSADPTGTSEKGDLALINDELSVAIEAGSAAEYAALFMSKTQCVDLVLENRTSDPGSPITGQIWFRTDV